MIQFRINNLLSLEVNLRNDDMVWNDRSVGAFAPAGALYRWENHSPLQGLARSSKKKKKRPSGFCGECVELIQTSHWVLLAAGYSLLKAPLRKDLKAPLGKDLKDTAAVIGIPTLGTWLRCEQRI